VWLSFVTVSLPYILLRVKVIRSSKKITKAKELKPRMGSSLVFNVPFACIPVVVKCLAFSPFPHSLLFFIGYICGELPEKFWLVSLLG